MEVLVDKARIAPQVALYLLCVPKVELDAASSELARNGARLLIHGVLVRRVRDGEDEGLDAPPGPVAVEAPDEVAQPPAKMPRLV
jgi:hypothetical protein